jgi:putative FmdB family regulatory protein
MPTYEYVCKACEHRWDQEQRIKDKPVKQCPSCGMAQAQRQISCTGFVLKGNGWANMGYSNFG